MNEGKLAVSHRNFMAALEDDIVIDSERAGQFDLVQRWIKELRVIHRFDYIKPQTINIISESNGRQSDEAIVNTVNDVPVL